MRVRRREPVGRCPRCGAPYFSSTVKRVGNRDYVYIYHGRDGRSGSPRYCYVGPRAGYEAVAEVKGASLANLEVEKPMEVISLLNAIIERRRRTADPEGRIAELRGLAAELRTIAREVGRMAGELEAEADFEEAELLGRRGGGA